MKEAQSVRKAVYAGSFYPDDPATLLDDINGYIEESNEDKGVRGSSTVKAIISPHAGYIYSGVVAGFAFKSIKKDQFKEVFLLGSAHRLPVTGLGMSTVKYWETPLGKVRVSDKSRQIVESESLGIAADESHILDHCLEVQLPFLQVQLGSGFEIVPVLVTDIDHVEAASVIDKYYGQDSLLLVSADLSHYLHYDFAVIQDQTTIESIQKIDSGALLRTGDTCGKIPVAIALELARSHKWEAVLLDYRNSGDTAGDKSAVVGYAAFKFVAGL